MREDFDAVSVGDLNRGRTRGRLDLSIDVSAVPTDPAGAGIYVRELSKALMKRDDVDVTLIARKSDADRWRELASERDGCVREVLPIAPTNRALRLMWEQVELPRVLGSPGGAPRVHHSPHYTMPQRARVPVVVTVHDLTFFDHPEFHERSKVLLFRHAIRAASERASAIVCVSRATADRLDAVCDVRAEVVVVPHGIDHERFSPGAGDLDGDRAELRSLGLDADRAMIVYVGTLEPRKGIVTLVEAFGALSARDREVTLVLAGQKGWGTAEIENAIARSRSRERIVVTGYVPDTAVPALLRAASAVVYAPEEEGFGLPAVEALACGAPLVTTQGSVMADLAGGAARLVAPGSTRDLICALEALLFGNESSDVRGSRRKLGLKIAASLTWEASAQRHIEAYEKALKYG